jgi:CRP/FNR family cyclic AMP-dependent transcriptional regulator
MFDEVNLVRVLEHDPDFAEALDSHSAALARQRLVARQLTVDRGPWNAEDELRDPGTYVGVLVLSGFVFRRIECGHEVSAELLGPGDILRPWDHDGDYALDDITASFEVLEPIELALLDDRFLAAAAPWPAVAAAVIARVGRRARWLAVRVTITQLERATVRVQYLLWHLADRWGTVTPEGVVVPIDLTHAQIAELIGARRPSVTNALGELQREGTVRRIDRGWLLGRDAPAQLDARLAAGA